MEILADRKLSLRAHLLSISVFLIALGTFIVAYIISINKGFIDYPGWWLSLSINFSPASNVASMFLSPAAYIITLISFVRYIQIEKYKPGTRVNKFSMVFAVLCAIGGHGVASIQESAGFRAHIASATLFFTFGALYLLLMVVNDLRFPHFGSAISRILRIFISTVMIVCSIILGILILTFDVSDEAQIARAAYLEIAAFLCFIAVYASFFPEFLTLKIEVYVRNHRKNENPEISSRA